MMWDYNYAEIPSPLVVCCDRASYTAIGYKSVDCSPGYRQTVV